MVLKCWSIFLWLSDAAIIATSIVVYVYPHFMMMKSRLSIYELLSQSKISS